MSPRRSSFPKKPRGVIVWDFDGVLFDIERFRKNAEHIFEKYGVPPAVFQAAIFRIRKEGGQFSVARSFRIMRSLGASVKEKTIRKALHNHLALTRYFAAPTDIFLRRLRNLGFMHIILSLGAPSYQHKKIRVGCGKKFIRHFAKISTTRKPKFIYLKKLARKYPHTTIFFIDDTEENIQLVQKHVPEIVTVHYSNISGVSLKNLERGILLHVKK